MCAMLFRVQRERQIGEKGEHDVMTHETQGETWSQTTMQGMGNRLDQAVGGS